MSTKTLNRAEKTRSQDVDKIGLRTNGAPPITAQLPTQTNANYLNPLGEKIFLDRYALKDGKKETVTVGDTIVVAVDAETGQREIGTVIARNGREVTIELRDGEVIKRALEHIDKPIETRPEHMLDRVAHGLAQVESPEKQAEWQQKFRWLLDGWKFVPGGRILTAAGTDQNLTFYNCYVIPSPQDSRGGIMTTLTQMTEIMSRGGGVGINVSSLRPHHAYVKGVNGRSSGAVSWGELYSFVTGLIEQGGSRRGALMLIMNVWHPDVLEFINSKRNMGRITNANISVGITDDFMAAVKADGDWDLVFPDTSLADYDEHWDGDLAAWQADGRPVVVHKTVRARDIWNNIIESAWASAEPGVFFVERYNKMSNSWYFAPILCTNPCGEQGLPGWGVCNLGALNMAKFTIDSPEGLSQVDWDSLRQAVRYAIRFLDNVIDTTPYFFKENEAQQLSERRVGMGTMGLAEMLIRLQIRYGSPECVEFLDELYQFIATEAYLASADYAAEKGQFAQFEADKFLQSHFMQNMPEQVRETIREQGIRNVTLLTQAPTGTTGTMVNTSTGIEPFYFWSFHRTGRMGTHEERVSVYEQWLTAHPDEPLPDYFVTAMDLQPEDHVRVQAAIQRWVDSSISKTCNIPNSYTVEQTRELYELMYELGCKGGTVYRDGSRDVQVLNLKAENKVASEKAAEPEVKWRARPSTLHGNTYRKNTPIGTAYITVNSNGGGDKEPFEVFINVGKAGSDVAADAEGLGRLVSLILRMPSPLSPEERVQDIVAQLRGIGSGRPHGFGKNRVMSMPDAVAQVLAEHAGFSSMDDLRGLPDEEENTQLNLMPRGDLCPGCGQASLLHIEGCKKCHECGYSEC